MNRRTFLLSLGAAALLPALPETAEAAVWTRLGTARVNGRLDREIIPVGRSRGTFRQIRLRVRDNDLLLLDIVVRYGNGTVDRFSVGRRLIRRGSYTRTFDLRGRDRFIREIYFTYGRFTDRRGPTSVEAWGRR
jgi:hypothetical protein